MFFLYKMFNVLHKYIVTFFMANCSDNNNINNNYNNDATDNIDNRCVTGSTVLLQIPQKNVDLTQHDDQKNCNVPSPHHEIIHPDTNEFITHPLQHTSTHPFDDDYDENSEYELVDGISSFFFIFLELKQSFDHTYKMNEEINAFRQYFNDKGAHYMPLKQFIDDFISKYDDEETIVDDIYKFCLEQFINNILILFNEYLDKLGVKQYILFDIDLFLRDYPLFEEDYNQICIVEFDDGLRNELFRNFLSNSMQIDTC